jgi:hypothetical protein
LSPSAYAARFGATPAAAASLMSWLRAAASPASATTCTATTCRRPRPSR